MPMNNRQARMVNEPLTNIAHGYAAPEFVGDALFPEIFVPKRGGKVIRFGKEAFMKHNTRRAPGAKKERVMYGFTDEDITLSDHDLEAQVPLEWLEESEGMPQADHEASAVNNTMFSMRLALECEQADLATDPNSYAATHRTILTGTDQWSHPDNDPLIKVRMAKSVIRRSIGVYPNTAIIPAAPWESFQVNPKVREQFKYTSGDSITAEMAARYLQVQNLVVAAGTYADAANPNADMKDIWGNSVILAYVPPKDRRNVATPSYGYTYVRRGHPHVQESYWEDDCDSWLYPTKFARRAYLTGMSAGFLLQDVAG